jgi:hypothetical protein
MQPLSRGVLPNAVDSRPSGGDPNGYVSVGACALPLAIYGQRVVELGA